jgi:hypothetical protein
MASPSHPPPVGIFIVKRRGGKKEKDRPDETEGNLRSMSVDRYTIWWD